MFNYRDFGLKEGNLYETLAITFSEFEKKDKIKPNTACMGIKCIKNNLLKINPYPETTTLKNLKKNGWIVINFIDDVYLYALAALKEPNSLIGIKKFPSKYYEYYEISISESIRENFNDFTKSDNILIPYINKAWLFLCGKMVAEDQVIKINALGELKVSEFTINIIDFKKLKESFKLFNRAENLALEIIVLASRLKIAKEKNEFALFNIIHEKILDHMENIKRFGKNKRALKSIALVNNYLSNLKE
ncbi:MAG: DUF447 domain-containing protein [Promethearchaeota archaeon]